MRNLLLQITGSILVVLLPAYCAAAGIAETDSVTPIKNELATTATARDFGNYFTLLYDSESSTKDFLYGLSDSENSYYSNPGIPRKMLRLVKLMQVKRIVRHRKNRQHLFLDLAGIAAQMNLFPFAMKCYYQSVIAADSPTFAHPIFGSNMQAPTIDTDKAILQNKRGKKSSPLEPNAIAQSFDDGKEVLACAVLLHVKQPLPGKRRAFVRLNNVGHTFITLIKYNTDSSVVTRSFGFYPNKNDLLAATPLHPASLSVIKDDGFHAWDQVAGKFISYRRLRRILRMVSKLENKRYDLNKNNCTDFALYAAMIGGIDVQDTQGRWPFGKGNNPACAGQSLLEGKITNADTGNTEGLFLWNNNQHTSKAAR